MSSYSAFSGLPIPVWTPFTPSTTGVSSEVVWFAGYFQIGKMVWINYVSSGTSTAVYKTFTLPFPINNATLAFSNNGVTPIGQMTALATAKDNGTWQNVGGSVQPGWDQQNSVVNANVCSLYLDLTVGNSGFTPWTASGAWSVQTQFFYMAA